jgi:16S rRNA (guanine966-N2)-methyltransferase
LSVTVTGGVLKGRVLAYPAGRSVRPTTQRTRESLFGSLGAGIYGAVFADLYAGAGGVGIEALSRGAGFVHFVERDAQALSALQRNLAAFGIEDERHRIHAVPVSALLARHPCPIADARVVFADPPYDLDVQADLLAELRVERFTGLEIVVVEHRTRQPVAAPDGMRIERERRFGDTTLTYLVPVLEG